MNRTLSYGAKLFAHLDPSKGVDALRQQDGGHGSRNPLRSVKTHNNKHALESVCVCASPTRTQTLVCVFDATPPPTRYVVVVLSDTTSKTIPIAGTR